MAREQAEHFWPWKPKAACATPSTASSISASASTMIASLPPISRMVRLIQSWPGCCLAALWLMCSPTSREPVKRDVARLGMRDDGVSKACAAAGTEVHHALGHAASSSNSTNFAAMVGESLDGFRTTVLPLTIEASVIPAMMAQAKFHGGITAPTPSGM
jgi:hypothetical protein